MAQILKTIRRNNPTIPKLSTIQYTPTLFMRWSANKRTFAVKQIQVAFMYKDQNGRFILGFYPGVTGYESYYLDDVKNNLDKLESKFVPTEGLFGLTKWENQNWFLCAGSDSYDTLTISMGGLREAIKTLEQRTKEGSNV